MPLYTNNKTEKKKRRRLGGERKKKNKYKRGNMANDVMEKQQVEKRVFPER